MSDHTDSLLSVLVVLVSMLVLGQSPLLPGGLLADFGWFVIGGGGIVYGAYRFISDVSTPTH